MRIVHQDFGRGIVRKVEGSGEDLRVTVLFDGGGERKFLAFFAKKARGAMTRYIIDGRVSTMKALKAFDVDGYRYSESESKGDHWVFLRD